MFETSALKSLYVGQITVAVDKSKDSFLLHHRRSITVSLETCPLKSARHAVRNHALSVISEYVYFNFL